DMCVGVGKIVGWSILQGGSLILICADAAIAQDTTVHNVLVRTLWGYVPDEFEHTLRVVTNQQYWKVITEKVKVPLHDRARAVRGLNVGDLAVPPTFTSAKEDSDESSILLVYWTKTARDAVVRRGVSCQGRWLCCRFFSNRNRRLQCVKCWRWGHAAG